MHQLGSEPGQDATNAVGPNAHGGAVRLADYRVVNSFAIRNYLISGSFFLQSLFDNHPQVLSLPHIYGGAFYAFWPKIADLGHLERVQAFIEAHPHWFYEAHATIGLLGPNRDQKGIVDPDKFSTELLRITQAESPVDRRSFYCAIHIAYAFALGRDLDRDNLRLLVPLHSAVMETVRDYAEDFPDALYLYTFRHPLTNFASGVRHMTNYSYFLKRNNIVRASLTQIFLDRAPQIGGYQVFGYRPYWEELRNQSRAIRLEDLHTYPRPVMKALADWIGLEWSETLMQSTLDGKIWWNTRPRAPGTGEVDHGTPKINGFDPNHPWREWKTKLTRLDRFRLNVIADRKNRAFGYEKRTFSPTMERWRRLIAMKLLWVPFYLECDVPLGAKRVAQMLRQHPTYQSRIQNVRPRRLRNWLAGVLLRYSDYLETRECLKDAEETVRTEGDIEVPLLEIELPDSPA